MNLCTNIIYNWWCLSTKFVHFLVSLCIYIYNLQLDIIASIVYGWHQFLLLSLYIVGRIILICYIWANIQFLASIMLLFRHKYTIFKSISTFHVSVLMRAHLRQPKNGILTAQTVVVRLFSAVLAVLDAANLARRKLFESSRLDAV